MTIFSLDGHDPGDEDDRERSRACAIVVEFRERQKPSLFMLRQLEAMGHEIERVLFGGA